MEPTLRAREGLPEKRTGVGRSRRRLERRERTGDSVKQRREVPVAAGSKVHPETKRSTEWGKGER